jgi:multicomponent Na+:H+ antiporter subunit G
MIDYIIAALIILGSLFILVAAIGVVKLQDVYMRMHAITKAASLGTLLLLVAVIISFPTWIVIIEGLMIILFIIMTAPVASHAIGRVAHQIRVEKSPQTHIDELENTPNPCEESEKQQ